MPVSGRRHQALQRDNAQLLQDNVQLLRELREVTEERDAAREVVRGLSERNQQVTGRPLAGGEIVLARALRQSEEARALLAAQLDLLQAANEGAARESYDAARVARAVAA
ncbi:hypothetical protein [Streptomyces sp. NPDC051577]|uniref:hypothetical protein n=1 Tax=Streptomyces sp. NPDC051577 TaxID=3155166 RepID=UPI00343EB4CF